MFSTVRYSYIYCPSFIHPLCFAKRPFLPLLLSLPFTMQAYRGRGGGRPTRSGMEWPIPGFLGNIYPALQNEPYLLGKIFSVLKQYFPYFVYQLSKISRRICAAKQAHTTEGPRRRGGGGGGSGQIQFRPSSSSSSFFPCKGMRRGEWGSKLKASSGKMFFFGTVSAAVILLLLLLFYFHGWEGRRLR